MKMLCCPLPGTSFFFTTSTRNHLSPFTVNVKRIKFKIRRAITLKQLLVSASCSFSPSLPSVHSDSLRVLEWDKLCDIVASFATTSLGREATKAQLWSVNQTYEQSLKLMGETNAALEMYKQGACRLDFAHIDTVLVKSALQKARRSIPVNGHEAIAVLALLECAETLQINLKGAIKEDANWYTRFMPLSEMITGFTTNNSLVRLIQQVIDENGSVKDSASSTLKHSREQVLVLERKMHQLMEKLIRSHGSESSILEVNNIGGRWCLKVGSSQTSFEGLLLSSGPGGGSIIEPLSAVPLNDELQRARALVAKAEAEVLSKLTDKIQIDVDGIEELLNNLVELDVMNARATYSASFRGTCPDVIFPEGDGSSTSDGLLLGKNKQNTVLPGKREWILYLPQAYHPLLLQRHRENLKKISKHVHNDTTGRLENGTGTNLQAEIDADYTSGRQEVSKLDLAPPVPVDFSIARKTRVLVITGPNTGGKTICLKTVGLAAMMAKSGLHVLASEPVRIPWFDSVFADIGDEQSLSQSLSTFSGHLRQISSIQSQSTSKSLVLLDEVGAGTNPLEGAALGMSLLEYFAEKGALLTVATTHHGELKTLKYSNSAFENASMEFDEVNLRPTYKVLWGIPGRSNAINIAERLGLPSALVNNARKLYGSASAEIDEVIIDMEKLKNDYQELLDEAHHHLMKSKDLYENLLSSRRRISERSNNLKSRKMHYVSEYAAKARSTIHKKVRQFHASTRQRSQSNPTSQGHHTSVSNGQQTKANTTSPTTFKGASTSGITKQSPSEKSKLPKVGDMVLVSSLGKEMKVISVDPAKEEIVVRAGIMTFKLKFSEI